MTSYCRVCGNSSGGPVFSASVLGQPVNYYKCSGCGYVQMQNPTWLERAYVAAINNCDTGIMLRNQANVGMVLATLACIGSRESRVVDFAGGYGVLVRLLRGTGVDALWSDPYCRNLFAVGFEHGAEKADLVMAFEAFEHFVDPVREAEQLFSIAPNVLISTEPIASPTPAPDQWWYYGLNHGQYIGFVRRQTLQFIADRFSKHLISDGHSYRLLTYVPFSASRWRVHTLLSRRLPLLYTRGMQSKVWSDFERMSGAQ